MEAALGAAVGRKRDDELGDCWDEVWRGGEEEPAVRAIQMYTYVLTRPWPNVLTTVGTKEVYPPAVVMNA